MRTTALCRRLGLAVVVGVVVAFTLYQKDGLPRTTRGSGAVQCADANGENGDGMLGRCDTIHIAIVCAGYKSSRSVVAVLKSILFYRQHPLHLHLLVDDASERILRVLFATWHVPHVTASYYKTDDYRNRVATIPTSHYSGVFGLLKLTLEVALPDVERLITLDTDVVFGADIAKLWEHFSRFEPDQVLGLVENQSEWYLGKLKSSHPWPAVGVGFNTGVMLMDLGRMRKMKWDRVWLETARAELEQREPGRKITHLADQDVINAVIKENPRIVYRLPCEWNIQLSDNSLADVCYRERGTIGVVHWNSPKKTAVANKNIEFFRLFVATFSQYDGGLLRRELLACPRFGAEKENTVYDECIEFRKAADTRYRTHLYYEDYEEPPQSNDDVTLVTQFSLDRLVMLEPLAEHWEGPMSLSIYLTDADAAQVSTYIESSPTLSARKNIGYHFIYVEGIFFPINYLRNVALDEVRTPFAFLVDIDFLPTKDLYSTLRATIASTGMAEGQKALVVPAFETFKYKFAMPASKADLFKMVETRDVTTFRFNEWPQGHAPTDFDRWRTASRPYTIQWAPDFEPYIVVRRDVQRYDTRFVGFGWNKVSHIYELSKKGYEFVVIPEGFIVHMPHSPSLDIRKFRKNQLYRMCLARLKKEFMEEMGRKS